MFCDRTLPKFSLAAPPRFGSLAREAGRGSRTNDMKVPFNKPSMIGREVEYLQDAIAQGQLSGDGIYTRRASDFLRTLTGSEKVLLTHSCTAALEMAAILCDLGPGDEVIMPSFTFVSTANAVALRGAVPVFVEIDERTLNIDPAAAEAAVTPATKAIFPVHYAGFPADMDAICAIGRSHDLLVVEDAAQALGSTYKGRPAGSLGDLAAFSFHETKNVISGEGGALSINRPELVERAEIIREKGTNRSRFRRGQVDKYTWVDVGSSFLPGELVASFLFAQLEREAAIRRRRVDIFERYNRAFAPLGDSGRVGLPQVPPHTTGNGHMFYLLMRDQEDRDAFIAALGKVGIGAPFHYVPLHSSPGGRRFGRTAGDGGLPVTDSISERLVRLPLFYTLGDEIERVLEASNRFFAGDLVRTSGD